MPSLSEMLDEKRKASELVRVEETERRRKEYLEAVRKLISGGHEVSRVLVELIQTKTRELRDIGVEDLINEIKDVYGPEASTIYKVGGSLKPGDLRIHPWISSSEADGFGLLFENIVSSRDYIDQHDALLLQRYQNIARGLSEGTYFVEAVVTSNGLIGHEQEREAKGRNIFLYNQGSQLVIFTDHNSYSYGEDTLMTVPLKTSFGRQRNVRDIIGDGRVLVADIIFHGKDWWYSHDPLPDEHYDP